MSGGWAFPNMGSRAKAHYWEAVEVLTPSLCGRWGYYPGIEFQGGLFSPVSSDDCASCRRKVAKLADKTLEEAYAEQTHRDFQLTMTAIGEVFP